jgi:catechol 2,3-dioxygenase-like lactoylglutathione lyase family enzyme
MITALHTLIYADDPEAARAFFRDVFQLPGVDTGGGWLIFRTGPSELGVHPSSWEHEGTVGSTDQHYDLSFICDDLAATVAELAERGAEFDGQTTEEPWGTTIRVKVPGAPNVLLYQPKYDSPAFAEEPQAMW